MAYEALYRRYRPSRFKDAFFGQDHVVAALRNAIEGDRVGHAYLFSGPRGTGKTTSARILAKALNCTNLQGGEPCNECDSCLEFQSSGGSYNLHELDAASNNGVDAMRDLIGKVALGSPGRTKVYILDEVHMLSSGAENALLKTLEEPPPHVVFVLCTTEPNKVVPTIRSRTQHLEFSLLSASQVGELIDHVIGDAGIELTDADRHYVMRAGGGSARDTLSALDQVVAAGGAPQGGEHIEALFQSLIDRDASAALASIDGALQAGRDAATIGTALLHELRTVFLAAMRADVSHLPEAERERALTRAASMPPARVTRAIEVIGTSIIEMRQAPDPRVDLEVAIMRLTRADLDTDAAAMLERLEAIESQLGGGAAIVPQPAPAPVATPEPPGAAPAPGPVDSPPSSDEPALAAPVHTTPAQQEPRQQERPAPAEAPAAQRPAAVTQGGGPQGAGPRGAAIARAELAKQGISPSQPKGAPADAGADAATASPAAPGGKTLADVRRERQAAALAGDTAAAGTDDVEAAATERRERQAAAQAAGQATAPPEHPAPAASVEPPPSRAPESPPAPQAAAPAPAPEEEPAPGLEPGPDPEAVPATEPVAAAPEPEPGAALPGLDELQAGWQSMLESMSGKVRSRFSAGHFVDTSPESVMFGLPNPVHRDRCEEVRSEVDQVLAAHFGRPIPLTLVVDLVESEPDFFTTPPSGGAGTFVDEAELANEEDTVDVHDLVDATGDVPSAQDRVMATFENSVLVEDPPNPYPNQ